MNRFLAFGLLFLSLVVCTRLAAQEIGKQGGDVFVPAAAPPPVSMPDIDSRSDSHHADQEGTLKFKSETVLVQVPAVVTDKSGNHVHNLSKDDFKILENGKQQRITGELRRAFCGSGQFERPDRQRDRAPDCELAESTKLVVAPCDHHLKRSPTVRHSVSLGSVSVEFG